MKSVMSHSFSQVPRVSIPRSSFNRSHGYKTTFDAGYLVPIFVDEALPGDTFNLNMTAFARLSTPTFPIMDNMYLETFFFACPIRLVWDNFQKFMGEQVDPGDSIDYTVPIVDFTSTGPVAGDTYDYMGFPLTAGTGYQPNNLHNRAYNLIWNEWFRDQNLQDSITVDKGDGPDSRSQYRNLQRRNKKHDYFTSCLPWPQKGDAVDLPLGTDAPVTGIGFIDLVHDSVNKNVYETDGTGTVTYLDQAATSDSEEIYVEEDPNNAGYPNIRADLTNATSATINQLRQSFQIQRLLERDARGGTRYTEIVRSHFGVTSPDQRLQRPEYLGGGSTQVNITPVLTTTDNSTTQRAGETAAYGTALANNHGFTKSFTEHTLLIGLVNVRADLTYQQGLNRMFSRQTRYDYYWPSLAMIGEQAVLNKEIYFQASAADENVFGYNERYAEYRYKPSVITGQFRSTHVSPLDAWHLSQEFTSLPTLGTDFIQDDPPIDRCINTPAEPHFILDAFFDMKCARPMPLYGVPGMIDHF